MITNLGSKFINSKWRIHYSEPKCEMYPNRNFTRIEFYGKNFQIRILNRGQVGKPEMKFFSIRMSIRSLPSIRKVYRRVSAVSQVYQRVTQGSPKKILQSPKLFRVYCGSIPISRRDLRSILKSLPKSTKCILNLRDIPNSLRSLQSIPNDPSEYTKSIRKCLMRTLYVPLCTCAW